MIAPTVNIVMTYRPEVMMAFQEAESFTAFTEERKKQDALDEAEGRGQHTYIFNNAPGSTFLELKHSYNEDDGAVLDIEIMDPQGVFEEAMLDNSVEAMLPINDDPLGAAIQKQYEELIYTKSEAEKLKWTMAAKLRNQGIPSEGEYATLNALGDQYAAQSQSMLNLDAGNVAGVQKDYLKLKQLEAARDARIPQMQRPVYIAYGMGDDLKDWSPPQCYGKPFALEYSFNGTGVRVIKLKFVGLAAHPNLMLGVGVSPFGRAFSDGLLTKGSSAPLFNAESAKAQSELFLEYVKARNVEGDSKATIDKYINAKRPSFHLAVTQALTEFIKAGSTEDNVLVLLPNLDKYLKPWLDQCIGEAKAAVGSPQKYNRGNPDIPRQTREDVAYFEGFKSALEGIGLTLSECDRYAQPGIPLSKAQPVGKNVFANLESTARAEEEVDTWFQTRQFKAVVQCDYDRATSFLDKLAQVANAIQTKFVNYIDEGIGSLNVNITKQPRSEPDMNMLTIMKEATLIPSAARPLILWGDNRVIDSYMYARAMEISAAEAGETNGWTAEESAAHINNNLNDRVHPMDVLNGLDYDYMQNVMNYIMPVAWLGPFGPNNSGDVDTIDNDANKLSNKFAELKKNQPLQASRMPVFTFGTKNPNILDIDIDLNFMFTAAMNMATTTANPSNQIVTGIIKPGQGRLVAQMFDKLEEIAKDAVQRDPDLATPPPKFVELIKKWYDKDNDKTIGWKSGVPGTAAHEFHEWSLLFHELADSAQMDEYKDITGSYDGLQAYADFMWKAFVTLYNKSKLIPLSQINLPSNKATDLTAMVKSTDMKEKIINEVMAGSIKTVPLFHLSTQRRVIWRPCQVVCIEPAFHNINRADEEIPLQRTWFSGQYELAGWKHTITNSMARSEFRLIKGASKGADLIKDGNLYTPEQRQRQRDAAIEGGMDPALAQQMVQQTMGG
jgi:hypothetical protein